MAWISASEYRKRQEQREADRNPAHTEVIATVADEVVEPAGISNSLWNFRTDVTVGLVVAGVSLILALIPLEKPFGVVLWMACLFVVAVYPCLHVVDWILKRIGATTRHRWVQGVALVLLAGGFICFAWVKWPRLLELDPTMVRFGERSNSRTTFTFTNVTNRTLYVAGFYLGADTILGNENDFKFSVPSSSRRSIGLDSQPLDELIGWRCRDGSNHPFFYFLLNELGPHQTKQLTVEYLKPGPLTLRGEAGFATEEPHTYVTKGNDVYFDLRMDGPKKAGLRCGLPVLFSSETGKETVDPKRQ